MAGLHADRGRQLLGGRHRVSLAPSPHREPPGHANRRNPYARPGDRVRIADAIGDVTERNTFVTKIRTTKNVEVTIPNAMVMSNHIVNYSGHEVEPHLILHTTVTLGYDVDWRQVHELMIGAALEVEGVLAEPAPYVLQTALDDFYVHYELNVHTDAPRRMSITYSLLHAKLQDAFAEAGIEIASPHLAALRDGNQPAMPARYLPDDYLPPAFRVVPSERMR